MQSWVDPVLARRRSEGSTSGSFRAGPVHSDPRVGLGPVDGAPPGGLAEAPGRGRQLGEGGPRRAGAAAALERVPAVPGVRSRHGGVGRALRGGGGAEGGGGLGHRRRDGEILNGWHWEKKEEEEKKRGERGY